MIKNMKIIYGMTSQVDWFIIQMTMAGGTLVSQKRVTTDGNL